jgi:hypothetical protein
MKKFTNVENRGERFGRSMIMCCMGMRYFLGMGGLPM